MPRIRQLTATLFRRAEESTRPLVRLADAMADAEAVAAIYRPVVEGSAISFEERAPDPAEMEQRMARTLERTPWLVAELNRKVVGYAYATQHRDRPAYRWSVEVSVYLAPAATGRGIGKRLVNELLSGLTERGFVNAFAAASGSGVGSPPARRAPRSLGATLPWRRSRE